MKVLAKVALVVALISLVLGIYSRLILTPLNIVPGSVSAAVFINFTNTCLLFAITLLLLKDK